MGGGGIKGSLLFGHGGDGLDVSQKDKLHTLL